MAGAALEDSFPGWAVLSFWLRSDQPIMAMTMPPETCMMGSEMPKKASREEPTSSMTARKMTVLMAMWRARER